MVQIIRPYCFVFHGVNVPEPFPIEGINGVSVEEINTPLDLNRGLFVAFRAHYIRTVEWPLGGRGVGDSGFHPFVPTMTAWAATIGIYRA